MRSRRSHLIGIVAVLVALLVVPTTPLAAAGIPTGPHAAEEVRLVDLINKERTSRGLAPLHVDLQLTRIARGHAADMADDPGRCGDGVTLRHRSPLSGGISAPWTTIRENVGCNRPVNVDALHDALMNSPGHRTNILAADVRFVGVGAWHGPDGGLWATQIFMNAQTSPISTAAVDEGVRASRTFVGSGQAPFVVLSRSDVFADSLGGAALAGTQGVVLFTDPPTRTEPNPPVRPETRAELDRVLGGSGRIYILGGTAAISSNAERELRSAGYDVRRLSGSSRYETGVAIAEEVVRLRGAPSRIAIASGANWPDAITGGAAAARHGFPLILTEPNSLPSSSSAFLNKHGGAQKVILGGTAAVSDRVRSQAQATRLAGPGRSETALQIADGLFGGGGRELVVVDGWGETSWGRALAWAPYAARQQAPQVMVADGVPASVATWILQQGDEVEGVRFAAGVSPTARHQVEQLLR